MSLRIDTKHMSQPEGGWSFIIPDGPILSSDKVGEPGLESVKKQIADYRAANGYPAGDPEHDIAKSYALRCPWLILEVPEALKESNDAEAWIHRMWRSFPQGMAEARVRDERFEQCLQCAHFEPLDTTDISNEGLRRLMLMNPVKTRTEHGWCLLRGWIPSVVVQQHQPIAFADHQEVHKDCWLVNDKKT